MAPKSKTGLVSFSADFSEAGHAIGVLQGMTAVVRTNRYIGGVLELSHALMADDFDDAMDIAHAASPQRYHHVYEWGTEGGKGPGGGRLWSHTLKGNGASREASWDFKASLKPIPSPQERAQNPNDPMSLVPQEELDKLSDRKYFFYWKAPVMEYNTPVNIFPRNVKALFVPTGDPANPFKFVRHQVRNMSPGGDETTGAFSTFWAGWWGSGADKVFSEKVQTVVETDLANIPLGQRYRTKTANIGIDSGFAKAKAAGEAEAEAYLNAKAREYSAAAKRRGK